MTPEVSENKPEAKNEQQQTNNNIAVQPGSVESLSKDISPAIKSEENQANWKAFREQRESERRAREDAEKRAQQKQEEAAALRAALEAITNKPNHNQIDNSNDIDDSEEKRIDRRVKQIIEEREVQARQQNEQREKQEAPQRIVQTFPDFQKVVTTENCDYLDYHYPELTSPFKYMPDGYDKWVAMYNAIKKFVPNLDSKKDMAKADKNLQKPGSISSTGTSQGTGAMQSNKLSEDRKAANWERMQRTLKGLS